MPSIFTKIVNGEIPCYKIAESADYLAFLDIHPIAEGHTLVIPKIEVDYIFDLPDEVIKGLFTFAKKVARGLETAIECKRVGILVVGTEVPHAHVHLVPFRSEHQMNILAPKLSFSQEKMAAIAASVRQAIEQQTTGC